MPAAAATAPLAPSASSTGDVPPSDERSLTPVVGVMPPSLPDFWYAEPASLSPYRVLTSFWYDPTVMPLPTDFLAVSFRAVTRPSLSRYQAWICGSVNTVPPFALAG